MRERTIEDHGVTAESAANGAGSFTAQVAAIWRDLLGLEDIGLDEEFFALGGHSLLAARMFGRIEAQTGYRLPYGAFAARPTIRTIAEAAKGPSVRMVPPVRRSDAAPGMRRIAPMSLPQQGLWLLERLRVPNSAFAVTGAWRLRGKLDAAALRAAVESIVLRHDALRATFEIVDDEPVQIIEAGAAIPFAHDDVSALPPLERDTEAERRIAAHARLPFDLREAPPIRALLVRAAEREHVLAVTMHHIVVDGWSLANFETELVAGYDRLLDPSSPPPAELPVSYADFAAWQREYVRGEMLAEHLDYWRVELAGAPTRLELPWDRPRPAVRSSRGGIETLAIPGALADRLAALGRERNSTLFMTLFAAFAGLVHRYTGLTDVVIASPVANRTKAEFEHLIGLFANTLPLRVRLTGDSTFAEVLDGVRRAATAAYEHQDVPFETVVSELVSGHAERDNAFCNVVFALQNTPRPERSAPTIDVERFDVRLGTAKFDLTVHAYETADGLAIHFEYDCDLFDAATIAAMTFRFERLLQAVARDADAVLGRIDLLSADERHRAVETWNDAPRALAAHTRVHEVFEERCERMPDAIAIVHGERRLTYGELNRRANRLARALRERGVGPGIAAGIFVERSIEMSVAALAILKAGGIYAPFDPAYPPERLGLMIADSGVTVMLTQRALAARLSPGGVEVIPIDEEPPEIAALSPENPRYPAEAADIAFLVYTSGSTGRPKGVLITHAGIVRLVVDTNYIRFAPSDIVAQVSNISFDAATFELWGALLSGAKLVIVPQDVLLSTWQFERFLRDRRVSVMFLTTSLFNQHARHSPAIFRTLRVLMVGGEALDPRSIRTVLTHGAPRHLLNGYGPTEVTTFACTHEITSVADDAASVPIGRPIANTEAYILDPHGNVVPPGVAGELHLGGIGVARGYLNDNELTARKFVPNPFRPGERLYRTGDLARYLADGTIDYIGRIDGQLKLRGFRIEPGEVESALRRVPGVREAAVTVRGDSHDARRLVAFVTLESPGLTEAEIKRAVAAMLPDYMMPGTVSIVEAFGLTPNGKRDLGALPAPVNARAQRSTSVPRFPLHHQILAVWERLLEARPIAIDDDFFELGGHSLLAARMLAEVESLVGRRLSPSLLLTAPTVEGIAQRIVDERDGAPPSPLTALRTGGEKTPVFFWHGDFTGGGYYARALAEQFPPDQPFYVFEPHGLRGDSLPLTIEAMAESHMALLRDARPSGPYLVGGFCSGGLVAFEVARRLAAAGETVRHVALIDAPPLDRLGSAIVTAADAAAKRAGANAAVRLATARAFERTYDTLRSGRLPRISERPAAADAAKRSQERMVRYWSTVTTKYRGGRYGGPLTFFVARDELAPPEKRIALGWSNTLGAHTITEVPGDHLTCITRYVRETGSSIAAAFARE